MVVAVWLLFKLWVIVSSEIYLIGHKGVSVSHVEYWFYEPSFSYICMDLYILG